MLKLLIVDDSMKYLNDIGSLLSKKYEVVKANSGKRALEILKISTVDAVLLDLELPDIDGLEVLSRIHAEVSPYLPIMMVTDHGEAENAVRAIKAGADDFVPKGFNIELLAAKLEKALEKRELEIRAQVFKENYDASHDKFIFASDAMKRVNLEAARLANVDEDVLLIGESGVGKDLIAHLIHEKSRRNDKPFVEVPIPSLNETLIESELFGHEAGAFTGADRVKIGKFESANGGTIYLPEISSLREAVQLKLLHFMQYKSISRVGQDARKPEISLEVRVIFATNLDPEDKVVDGSMRADFYHRIMQAVIEIPPLRERREDIEPLVRYFLDKYKYLSDGKRCEIDPDALVFLLDQHWDGNVRSVESAVKDAVIKRKGDTLKVEDFVLLRRKSSLSKRMRSGVVRPRHEWPDGQIPKLKEAEIEFKRTYYKALLEQSDGNISRVAKKAGMSPQGLRKTLKQLGIEVVKKE
ncbi:MAG: sigma-54 dependent transcriptional regulator [Bacteroidetes bacterium]|nr:sigma-54 dependent transcriptional regulator [Bacteroidota bacterium]